jgi:hypothetical protein
MHSFVKLQFQHDLREKFYPINLPFKFLTCTPVREQLPSTRWGRRAGSTGTRCSAPCGALHKKMYY